MTTKVLLIGLGSIGKRHIRVLNEITTVAATCVRSGNGQDDAEFYKRFNLRSVKTLEEAFKSSYDFAIIANPTSLHLPVAMALAKESIPFLIEKPVSHNLDGCDDLLRIIRERKLAVTVGFHLRHHPSYIRLSQLVRDGRLGRILHFHGSVGQHLETWRPGTDYRQSYSARQNMGGGVILDLAHELDIVLSLMGPVSTVSCISGRFSDLEIETEDMADMLLEHGEKSTSHIHLDYLDHDFRWETRIIGTEGTALWDYGKGITELVNANGFRETWPLPEEYDRDSIFRDQMRHWMDTIRGQQVPSVTLEEGIAVTRLAAAAAQAARQRKTITL